MESARLRELMLKLSIGHVMRVVHNNTGSQLILTGSVNRNELQKVELN